MIEITINGYTIQVAPEVMGFDEAEWLELDDDAKHETLVDWLALNFKFNDTRLPLYEESKHV